MADLDDLEAFAENAKRKIPALVDSGALLAAEHAAGALRDKVLRVFDTRTGGLARSFQATFLGDQDGGVAAVAASDLVYARIQDEGGVILPKTVKRLAIPLKRNPVGRWPRNFAKGELFRTGNILRRADFGAEPLFVLKSRVELRGKNYVQETLDEETEEIADILGDTVFTAVKAEAP